MPDNAVICPVAFDELDLLVSFAFGIDREKQDPLNRKNAVETAADYVFYSSRVWQHVRHLANTGWSFRWVMQDDRPAGFMAWKPQWGALLVDRFWVEKSFRRRGLSHVMLDALTEAAREAGVKQILLDISWCSAGGVAIFRHLGFHESSPKVFAVAWGPCRQQDVLVYDVN